MTDLEITKLCAEAMKFSGELQENVAIDVRTQKREIHLLFDGIVGLRYNPLEDDEQAMALVKKFGLHLGREDMGYWIVEMFSWKRGLWMEVAHSKNLNRAICECVAKMQAGRSNR